MLKSFRKPKTPSQAAVSPKTLPRANAMTHQPSVVMSKETMRSKRIKQDVDAAAEKFRKMQGKLKLLVSSVKEQHVAMLVFNEKRVKTARQFEWFVVGSPLWKIVGEFELGANKPQESVARVQVAPEKPAEAPPGKPEAEIDQAPTHEMDSESEGEGKEEGEGEEDTESEETEEMGGSAKKSDESDQPSPEEEQEKKEPPEKVEETVYNPPVIEQVGSAQDAVTTFASVHNAAHELTITYAAQYYEYIIKYVEEWEKTVSSRIEARLMEFDELQTKLNHYERKVEQMRESVNKQQDKNKTPSSAQNTKWQRNELKLQGAREAYDSFGQSLFLLMDEVTTRAWKDMYPLVIKTVHFDLNYTADEAEVCSKLSELAERIRMIGEDYEVNPQGRLKEFKGSHPEEFYTGDMNMVRPVTKTAQREDSFPTAQ